MGIFVSMSNLISKPELLVPAGTIADNDTMVDIKSIAFIDAEISMDGTKVLDIGAITNGGAIFHSSSYYI